MKTRFRQSRLFQMDGMPCQIYLRATIGASGAVTLTANRSQGVVSITKEATAGQYTIVLQDNYTKFLGLTVNTTNATGISAAPDVGILSTSNVSTSTGGVLAIQFSSSGVATNPASGDILHMQIKMSQSSI